ncbi:hypothetical protein ACRALDRAFT_1081148 [Sodiomyces alcalophilus JCM 7366]|uniref:uncharacterized protein n=1 Tax=Sodiomyces alcalophilus JCM 7366 TaxID=591952 RepID=UPI0039B37451
MEWLGGLVKATNVLGAVLAFPLRLIWSLVSTLVGFILTLLAPVIYILSYSFRWLTTLVHFCTSPFQPLYIFITCGAIIGGLAGVVMAVTSEVITSALGMHDGAKEDYDESISPTPTTTLTTRPTSSKTGDSSPCETEWHFLETMPPRRRERTVGLVSQTIHEEESNGSEL